LKQIIRSSSYADQIKFLGYRTDVYELMLNAIALVVPSKFEGFGFITAEAMFNGCLVIGKNTAGTKEQFDNGLEIKGEEIGIRYNTVEELSQVMLSICRDGIGFYYETIKKAQETVVELYSSNRNADKVFNTYKEIIEKG
jgi:glycosyltransferase involved in cell wall biosynthesis